MGTPWGPVWVPTSIVHQYGTVERSVEFRRVLSCKSRFRRKPIRTQYGPTGPDEPRRITRLSRIGVRLIYGPIRDPDVPSWDPTGPNLAHQSLTPGGV